jgi:hypothetical protein
MEKDIVLALSEEERRCRLFISEKYGVTPKAVTSMKKSFGFKTFKRLSKHIALMERVILAVSNTFANGVNPHYVKELYPDTKYSSACAWGFVDRLFRVREKGVPSKALYLKAKEAVKILRKNGFECHV